MLSRNKRLRQTHLGNRPETAAMADSSARKRSLKLSLFVGLAESFASDPAASRSPRSFDDGVVGLGIVAAMSDAGAGDVRPARPPAPARSEPIPIAPTRPGSTKPREAVEREEDEEEAELSESYTCVISHVGGNAVTKRVYFDDGSDGIGGKRGNPGVFFESPPPRVEAKVAFPPASVVDFLSSCYLCQKKLHGLDIFMYRGDKAFCSSECRCQQILYDERREKCSSEESPCSAPLFFAPGVAAA